MVFGIVGISVLIIFLIGTMLFFYFFRAEPGQTFGNFAGEAMYDTLSAEQKQAYWDCFKTNKCSQLLAAKKNKEYRECSLSCNKQAQTATETKWCEDPDQGDNFLEKGTVKTNIYPGGKEDSCYTFPNGKTYLFEGRCKDNKYQYVQKNCAELGKDYVCNEGACIKESTEENPSFKTVVIFDDGFYSATDDEIKKAVGIASDILKENLNFGLELKNIYHTKVIGTDIFSSLKPLVIGEKEGVPIINSAEVEFIIIFSPQFEFDEKTILMFGGLSHKIVNKKELEKGSSTTYAQFSEGDYCNRFYAPVTKSQGIYIAFVDWTHYYGWCGYDRPHYLSTGEWKKISDVSVGGECKGAQGLECVYDSEQEFYFCPNLLNDPQQKLSFSTGWAIAHELLHSYGMSDAFGHHWGHKKCRLYYGEGSNVDYYNVAKNYLDIGKYLTLCPYIIQNSEKSFVGCENTINQKAWETATNEFTLNNQKYGSFTVIEDDIGPLHWASTVKGNIGVPGIESIDTYYINEYVHAVTIVDLSSNAELLNQLKKPAEDKTPKYFNAQKVYIWQEGEFAIWSSGNYFVLIGRDGAPHPDVLIKEYLKLYPSDLT